MPSRTTHLLVVASALLLAFACSSFDADPIVPPNGGGVTSYSEALTASLGSVGCVRHEGRIVRGVIGLPGPNGRELFRCEGVRGDQIRAMVAEAREVIHVVPGLASSTAGYTIRHYLSQEYCVQVTSPIYIDGHLAGWEVHIDEESCFWVTNYWDEWVPGNNNDPIPSLDPGGGGPFYSPTDPEKRTPTIDTIPNLDHTCDGVGDDNKANFRCLRMLEPDERAVIYDSIDVYLRPLSEIADSAQRADCDSMFRWMDNFRQFNDSMTTKWASPWIWAGRTDSVSPGKNEHDAQTNGIAAGEGVSPALMHLDPKLLENMNKPFGRAALLRAMMHESAHAWRGLDHPEFDWAVDSDSVDVIGYSRDPFYRTLHAPNTCVLLF